MRLASIGMAIAFACSIATPANAAVFTYVVTGTVVADTSNQGAAFGENVLGSMFSARFEVDDAAPLALYAADAGGSSAQGGGLIQDGTRPPVRAVLTINGTDYTIRTGDKDEPPLCFPGGECFGRSLSIDDAGGVVKSVAGRRLDLFAGYDSADSCCADYGSYSSSDTDDLRFSLTNAAFIVPDYRQTGTFQVSGTGSFSTAHRYFDRSGGVDTDTRLTLAATALRVDGAVPEPATWALMILGFGLVGAVLRQGRVPALRPACAA
jgi:hypothetical protein